MFINGYPYTDFEQMNLDFVLKSMEVLKQAFKDFTASNSLIFAEPLLHDLTNSYAKNTIVLDANGNAYISLKSVPEGVQLSNTEYWMLVFDYESYMEKINKNFTGRYYRNENRARTSMTPGDWLTFDDVLCVVSMSIAADDLLEVGRNINHFTIENFIKDFMDSTNDRITNMYNDFFAAERQHMIDVQAEIDRILAGATVDSEVIDARLGANGRNYSTLGTAIREQFLVNNGNDAAFADSLPKNIRTWISHGGHTLGWQTGYWGNSGNIVSDDSSICTATNYSSHEGAQIYDATFGLLLFPADKRVVVKVYDWADITILKYRYDFDGGFGVFPMHNECRTVFSLGSFDHDASDYCHDPDYVSQIVWYYGTKDQIIDALRGGNGVTYDSLGAAIRGQYSELSSDLDYIISALSPINRDWVVSESHPYGWRTGFWGNSGSQTSSDDYIDTIQRYNAYEGAQTYDALFGIVTFPSDKILTIKEYDSSTNELLNRYDFYNGKAIFKMNNLTRLGFMLGPFNGDAADYCDDGDYISQIKWSFVGARPTKKPRTDEFEHFTVKTVLTWPDVTDTTSGNDDNYSETDITCVLTLPLTYTTNGKPTPLIMFGHGAGCHVSNSSWYNNSGNFLAMIRAFTAAGYAVFDVDNTRGDSDGFPDWGSLPLMQAYIKAWDYIKENYNVESDLYLLSDSMGTIASLNMLKWYPSKIKTAVLTSPRPVVKERYENYTGDDKDNMAAAYGLTDGIWDDERLKGFCAHENIIQIDSNNYLFDKFPPIKVMVGTGDTSYLTQVREYFTALNNSGNFVNYREVSGATHGQMSFLSIGDLLAEAVNWMNRFRS